VPQLDTTISPGLWRALLDHGAQIDPDLRYPYGSHKALREPVAS
jgi:hypothetical protein